jgi:group I intron endonuclease
MDIGVYYITSKATGHQYFGSSIHLHMRLIEHFTMLRCHTHPSVIMQTEYDMYGIDNFLACILLYCDKQSCTLYEQICLDNFESTFNIQKHASHSGRNHTMETKERIKQSELGKYVSMETRQKQSQSMIGHQCYLGHKNTDITKEKHRQAALRQHHPELLQV